MKLTIKKLFAVLILSGLGITASFAQAYEKGDNLLNVGIGLGGGFGTPIGLSFEHGFSDKISGGAYVAYATTDGGFAGLNYTYILTAARASYHFDLNVDKLDPYIGAILGYNIASVKFKGGGTVPGASAGGVIYGGHVGARYYVSEKIGVFAEAGYGIGNLNAGIAFKF